VLDIDGRATRRATVPTPAWPNRLADRPGGYPERTFLDGRDDGVRASPGHRPATTTAPAQLSYELLGCAWNGHMLIGTDAAEVSEEAAPSFVTPAIAPDGIDACAATPGR